MRITHQMISRNYITQMNRNRKGLSDSTNKMSSGRAYNKAYENVSDAGKALNVRKQMADSERNLAAIRDAKGRAESAESGIRTVVQLLTVAQEKVTQGLNGTFNEKDRENIAIELETAQQEVLAIMNNTFSDKFLYSAAGNMDGSAPFKADGYLTYNGAQVDFLERDPATGKAASVNRQGQYTPVPWNEDNYIDIGFGYEMAGGGVDPNTAFKDTFSGLDSFGYGVNKDGVPLNAYSLLGSMATHLRSGNKESLGLDLNAVTDSMNYMLTSITEIGARGVTLENTANRLESEYITLADRQYKLEGIDLAGEAVNNKQFEANWAVTLQMGSRVLPQSIFDFIR